ncbi:MAG: hypothetical protein Q8L23_09330 [Caulobacter sp.]|nr:hypothetical protein [Caulobacter sp.]
MTSSVPSIRAILSVLSGDLNLSRAIRLGALTIVALISMGAAQADPPGLGGRHQPTGNKGEAGQTTAHIQRTTRVVSLIVEPAPTPQSLTETAETERREAAAAAAAAAREWWLVGLTGILTAATIALGVFTFLLWRSTSEAVRDAGDGIKAAWAGAAAAAEANRISNAAMEADQRAWVSATATTQGRLRRLKTHLGVDGFYLTVAIETKNHGKSPATNVYTDCEIRLFGPSQISQSKIVRDFANIKDHEGAGEVIFPDAIYSVLHEVFLPLSDIENIPGDFGGESGFKLIAPYVVGRISYQTPGMPGILRTVFCHALCRIGPNGEAMVFNGLESGWWDVNSALARPGTMFAT